MPGFDVENRVHDLCHVWRGDILHGIDKGASRNLFETANHRHKEVGVGVIGRTEIVRAWLRGLISEYGLEEGSMRRGVFTDL